jgi:hypothetical protein
LEFSEAFSPVRAIQHGIAAIQRAPASLLVGGFAIFLVDACSGGGGNGDFSSIVKEDSSPEEALAMAAVVLAALAVGAVVGFFAFLVRCWLLPGWIRLHRHVLEHGTDSFPLLFGGGDAFLPLVGWRLLFNIVSFGTFVVAAIPGAALIGVGFVQDANMVLVGSGVALLLLLALPTSIYVALGLSLGDHAVALEGMGPLAALDRSWELTRGNRLTLFVYLLVTGLFTVLGFLLCCVGVIGTRAVTDVGTTESYLLLTVPGADKWTAAT